MGRTQLGGGLKIAGHAHAQLHQSVARRNLAEQRKMRRGRLVGRRNTHQALDGKLQRPACRDKFIRVRRQNPGLLRLFSRVNLNETAAQRARTVELAGQVFRQFLPVEGLDHIEQRNSIAHLVGLQRPHKVQF